MTICRFCMVGLVEECINPKEGHAPGWIIPCGGQIALEQGSDRVVEVKHRGGHIMDPDELTNDTSAGRKRAAMLAPILDGMMCEWAGLKFAGGGVYPILGCKGNRIAKAKSNEQAKTVGADEVGHIHHGPDKAVLNNAVGVNLHRVCSRCHNRWHALNDPEYAHDRPHVSFAYLPEHPYYDHDPMTRYTDEEYEKIEEWWAIPRSDRGPYPFEPTHLQKRLPLSDGADTVSTTANLFAEDEETS